MMQNFKYSYDEENDDLFLYLENSKSYGAIELGNFIFDLDENKNIIAMQILDASQVLSKLLSNLVQLNQIKEIRIGTNNFRNMRAVKMLLTTSSGKSEGVIALPDLDFESPVNSF